MQNKPHSLKSRILSALLLGTVLSGAWVVNAEAATKKKAVAKKAMVKKHAPARKGAPLAVGKPGGTSGAFASVNGVPIPQVTAETFIAEQVAQGTPDSPELRKAVRDELIRREVVSQAAKADKIDKAPETLAQIELSKQAILIRAYVQNYLKKNPTNEDAIQAEYARLKANSSAKEYKSRHILVETEDEAKAIIGKLNAGEKFESLATQSKDPGSKETGGDLGWSQPKDFVKPFADAVTALEKGKFTAAPVKTEFGWHVIQLEDSRTAEPPPYEHIKAQLTQHVQQQKIEALINSLQSKAKID